MSHIYFFSNFRPEIIQYTLWQEKTILSTEETPRR